MQVSQAKEYIRRHEGELETRLAHSRNTKDIMARFNIVMIRVNNVSINANLISDLENKRCNNAMCVFGVHRTGSILKGN